MLTLNNNIQILKESYFGKSKHLEEAERLLDNLILIAKQKQDDGSFKLSETSTNKKLEKVLVNQFGVKDIHIDWIRTPNASMHTRPYITQFSGVNEFINKKNYNLTKVFKNKDKEIFITGTDSLLTSVGLTAQEILGIILHEIGHNFDTTTLAMVTGLPVFWVSKFMNKVSKTIEDKKDDFVRKNSNFYDILMDYLFIFSREMSFLRPITRLLPIIKPVERPDNESEMPTSKMRMIGFIGTISTYGSERFADSFAASYGYAQHLSSALLKLEKYYKGDTSFGAIVNSTPILKTLYAYANIYDSMMRSITCGHPEDGVRIKASINKLKRDINDPSISKELKAEIKKDLEALEDLYDSYLKVEDMPEFKNKVSVAHRMMSEKLFQGKFNVHEIFDPIYTLSEV